ncbi:hypothetical protein NEAUS04_1556 [Nematocida ausubeli]|uniref:Uncharacterized protein n=1 Tax=Nematocida ausubeli (strain ATCC PRA-371 / ERTm2) TaxID=1913371 RepID=H8ZFS4_NEMA1|nr:uncharacterized protein NESG_00491 [Nematocida ausubeli]EHY64476.1 hypothetical protein NERG_02445 [Nematocida ausubeli]KAI5136379.1 hypothetical protein NEAUS07_1609 [Nematocida ausubeli]KAI5136852.1 hypothetical protein NEAUS06_2047 [Nematocida ausubeli]KAI5149249.1 hypothetical protein NEAUS05_1697 [Nematocida ausubeli]KAI5163428.1 hypothetical protein NEAUS04_1556 [Nematocida ausubeli]
MPTVLIVDASAVISLTLSEMGYTKGYLPQVIADEIKCQDSSKLLSLHMCKLEIRNPTEESIKIAADKAAELGYTGLSAQDIELAALALEVSNEYTSIFSSWLGQDTLDSTTEVVVVTLDIALKNLVTHLGLQLHDSFKENNKKYLQRCYTCTRIYKTDVKQDFCKSCGYHTISKVSYTETDGKIELNLSKNFKYTEKKIHTHYGKEIRTQDQKEYKQYKRAERYKNKKNAKGLELIIDPEGWNCS